MPETPIDPAASPAARQDRPSRLAKVVKSAKWVVLLAWVALAVVATVFASRLGDVQRNDSAAYLPDGFDSSQVARLAEPDPGRPASQDALVVYHRADGAPLTSADRTAIDQGHRAAGALNMPGAQVPGEVRLSRDKAAALFTVRIQPSHADDDTVATVIDRLRGEDAISQPSPAGLQVDVTGEAALDADNDGGDVDGPLLLTSMVIVAVLLLLTYRSPVLWLVPLLAAGLAVMVARGAAYGLARAGLAVTDLSSAILIVLVFGAATDYALLLLNRYREELSHHADRHEALARALRRTAPAIVASAATVTAAMLCLLVADLAGLRGLGPVAATGIVIALAAMLTLLPALLACAGRWLLWPRIPTPDDSRGATDHRLWGAVADRVTRRPRLAASIVTGVLAVAALGLTALHTSADPLDKVPPQSDSVNGRHVLAQHFPEGLSAPLTVVLPAGSDAATVTAVQAAASATPDVAQAEPGRPLGDRPTLTVDLAVPPYGQAAAGAIDDLRDRFDAVRPGVLVGGAPAVQLDYREAALDDTKRIVPLVLLAVTLILCLLLRSIAAPLMLLATVVLSFAASLGVSALVFTHLLGFGGVAADLFIYIFVFLVALGVDYNIFLMERVREERRHVPNSMAVHRGLTATGGVITAAGLVLAGTFAALAQIPDVTVAQVGIAVGVGVLIDTLLVRALQVPALAILLGDRTWWPARPPRVPVRRSGAGLAGTARVGGPHDPDDVRA
ncbi:MMPL family transporter [Actinomadura sp. 7K507]|uniref:MMPL family transporter n=1 Tax=Actinomadura sp. 7K507 TaxID=2530365 RepID=UPI0014054842|nr:MMPL family transporter [Actinomadura sp. 7K507]